MCVIPFILNNSETWDSIPLEALNMLVKLQDTFYCNLFATPLKGTSKPSLLWESGGLPIKHRILKI